MELTEEQARAVRDAFGPCTNLYECNTIAELVAEDFDLKVALDVESIVAERMDDTGACYREWKAAKLALLKRLEALDFLK